MPPRTRNQGKSDRKHNKYQEHEEWEMLDDNQVEKMLHDDDSEEEEEEEDQEEEEEEDEQQDEQKEEKKGSKDKDQTKNKQDDSSQEETKIGLQKQKSSYTPPNELDPMVHLVEQILGNRVDDGQKKYLVKFKGLSHAECEWVEESQFSEKLSYQCQQKLKRYLQKQEKNRYIVPSTVDNDGEQTFFDKSFLEVDKILSSTNIFPIIHPRQAKNVVDTWRERCIDILQLIANYRDQNHCFGVPFLFLRTDEKNSMDFTTINNRLYTIPPQSSSNQNTAKAACYTKPQDFWNDLGQVFKENCPVQLQGTRNKIYIETLREYALYLYQSWHELINPSNIQGQIQNLLTLQQVYQEKGHKNDLNNQILINQITQKIKQLVHKWKEENLQCQDQPQFQANNLIIQNLTLYVQLCEQQMTDNTRQQKLLEQILNSLQNLSNCKENAIVLIDNENQTNDDQQKSQIQEQKPTKVFKIKLGEENVQGSPLEYQWLLENNQTIDEITSNHYLGFDFAKRKLMNSKDEIDPLYLVKWKNQSYVDSTWEPLSKISSFDIKIKDYERFNRSLDQSQRQKLMGFGYAHKQLLKIFQKKIQLGKKIESKSNEETQTREMMNKLLKFESKMIISNGYFQYSFESDIVPTFRGGQTMKEYQISGLNWMLRAWDDNRNVVLADEMGLGKTIMTIAFLDHLAKIYKIRGPFLVIAPLSTLDHWKRVAEEWTFMNVVVYHDQKGQEGRDQIINWEWYYIDVTNRGTVTQKSRLPKFNLLITSYEVFNLDLVEVLREVPFLYVVVDEAHRLKNKQTKTLQLLKEHPCRRILLLTGTPVQNNTKELFTLLNYIEPDKFNSFDNFMREYGKLETVQQVEKLHRQIRPHFLRRMKDEVENSIPPLKETVIDIGLTSLQQTYYKGIYGENLQTLASLGSNSLKAAQFNNIDIQLRKCCNHLFLLKGVEEELVKDCKTDSDVLQKLLDGSGKLILLDKFIEKYKKENHKMLVFSQFKGMIDIIKEYLTLKGVRYEMLTGSVKSADRGLSIQRFNEDSEFGIFLLTTRAGGLGINLTKARVVVIFDSDWNPQNDLQAIARAHRIGQLYEVSVYRFITAKTYEQQMFDRASRKLGMEQALFQKGAFSEKDGSDSSLANEFKANPQEIENLLKYGAYAFLDEDNENPRDLRIDEILAGTKKSSASKKNQYTLHKSSFNISEGRSSTQKNKMPDIKDPNFWEKVLPFDGFNPKQLMRKFRSKKADLQNSKESQSKFMKEVNKCVKDLLEAKAIDESLSIDEELYDLLKKISKSKTFENKYRDKSQVLLSKILHFQEYQSAIIKDYQVDDNQNGQQDKEGILGKRQLKRTAKQNVDYTSNKKRDKKGNEKGSNSEDLSEEETLDQNSRKRFNRLCKGNKQKEDDEFEFLDKEDEEDVEQDEEEKGKETNQVNDDIDMEDQTKVKSKKDKKQSVQTKKDSDQNNKYPSKNHCYICEKIEPPVDIKCNKYCKKYIHFKCINIDQKETQQFKEGLQNWTCEQCEKNQQECFSCNKVGQISQSKENGIKIEAGRTSSSKDNKKMEILTKCGLNSCPKYYHKKCLQNEIKQQTKLKQKTSNLKCQLHYCAKCKLTGDKLIECIKCPKAYHKKCIDENKHCFKRISKRFMSCSNHKQEKDNQQIVISLKTDGKQFQEKEDEEESNEKQNDSTI